MLIETNRLRLRPWYDTDAADLYFYAKEPQIGAWAGFPPHASVQQSLIIIQKVLQKDNVFAVVDKESNQVIGSIGVHVGEEGNLPTSDQEAEIGFWLGVPFWGHGLMTEGVLAAITYAFETLNMKKLWCGYFDGNERSRRVQEKCGFEYAYTNYEYFSKLMQQVFVEHVGSLTKERWLLIHEK